MSAVTWGMLEKSQVDPEKIEEAVDRIVEAHNDDPDSHLEDGQALKSHKAELIIDHVARSVVRDKLAFDRFNIDEHFSTIDAWNISPGVILEYIAQMTLATGAVINTRRFAQITPGDITGEAGFPAKNPNWETRIGFNSVSNILAYITQGEDTFDNAWWGFKIINNALYAVWTDADVVEHTQFLLNIYAFNYYRVRCELVNGVSLKFFVNDALLYTLFSFSLGDPSTIFNYSIKNTTAVSKSMWVQVLHWDADY